MENYNGWTNYATWRVNAEILSDIKFEGRVCPNQLKENVKHYVFDNYEMMSGSHLMESYARAFIEQVNYYEIAENINEDLNE